MSSLEDKYYYKAKSILMELQYFAQEVKEANGVPSIVTTESKREEIRAMLARSDAYIRYIQSKMGEKFTPEFKVPDDER